MLLRWRYLESCAVIALRYPLLFRLSRYFSPKARGYPGSANGLACIANIGYQKKREKGKGKADKSEGVLHSCC